MPAYLPLWFKEKNMEVIVNKGRTIYHNGKAYKYGEVIDLEEDEATRLLSFGAVTAMKVTDDEGDSDDGDDANADESKASSKTSKTTTKTTNQKP
jgi:hypothetical protein